MAGINIKINSSGGSGSGSGGGAPTTGNQLATSSRMIFNDFSSNSPTTDPLIPYTLLSGAINAQNQSASNQTSQAKTVQVFAASTTNNSGVKVVSNSDFGFGLGKGAYGRAVVKFLDQGSPALNEALAFTFGFNGADSATSSTKSIIFRKINNDLVIQSAQEFQASNTLSTTPFPDFDKYIVFEIEYLEDNVVKFTVSDLETGDIILEYTESDPTKIINFGFVSGGGVRCVFYCTKPTNAVANTLICAIDYVGFGSL